MIDVAHDGQAGRTRTAREATSAIAFVASLTQPGSVASAAREAHATDARRSTRQRQGAHCGQSASGRGRARITEGEARLATMPTLAAFRRPWRTAAPTPLGTARRSLSLSRPVRRLTRVGGRSRPAPAGILARSPIPTTRPPLEVRSGGRDRLKGSGAGAGRERMEVLMPGLLRRVLCLQNGVRSRETDEGSVSESQEFAVLVRSESMGARRMKRSGRRRERIRFAPVCRVQRRAQWADAYSSPREPRKEHEEMGVDTRSLMRRFRPRLETRHAPRLKPFLQLWTRAISIAS